MCAKSMRSAPRPSLIPVFRREPRSAEPSQHGFQDKNAIFGDKNIPLSLFSSHVSLLSECLNHWQFTTGYRLLVGTTGGIADD